MFLRSFVAALLLTFAFTMYLLDAVSFLAPYRRALLSSYLQPALRFLAMWLLALSIAIYLLVRLVTLGRVGKRLDHVSRDGVPLVADANPSTLDDGDA
jgi:hypothetical protein